jgi:hypothetical protein
MRKHLSKRPVSRQHNFAVTSGNSEVFSWEACSLFILEKGKPVVRSGRKAVDLDRLTKRRGSLVTERMTVCHAR